VPQLPDRRWWHETGPQHLPLGELAPPDRVQGVGLGPSRGGAPASRAFTSQTSKPWASSR
jgi:hypothetical protein